jgi:imidazole glycerol phosphate synthase glutamine amidotransferase subunit
MAERRPVTVIDSGHGNLASVVNAIEALGARPRVTSRPDDVAQARTIVFPGQGAAPAAMESLRSGRLDAAIRDAVSGGAAFLGICLGMQVLLGCSEEGPVATLDLIPGTVRRFSSANRTFKVPQIGWNTVRHTGDPLFAGIPSETHFYFVHSYYCFPDPTAGIGWTEYGIEYCSALRRGNLWAVQFHPEKSGPSGLRLLTNFLGLSQC